MSREDGYSNLVPLNQRTKDEQRTIQSDGGKASGVSRRRKRSLKETADLYLSKPVTDVEVWNGLSIDGIDPEDIDHQMAMVAGLSRRAIQGDAKAAKVIVDIIGPDDSKQEQEKPYELPARVLGKAFVDLNRNIQPNISYVLEGGRGSLKSSFWSLKIIEILKNNPDVHACITRQVAGTLKDSVYAGMKWAINELGLTGEFECKVSPLEIKYKKTGQTIYFRGLDDETKLKSIKPEFGYIGILWKEEKDQMKGPEAERSVNQSVLRGGDLSWDFSSYNPPKSKDSWVNKEKLIPNPNRVVHSSTYLEAPPEWLGKKFIEDAEHLKEVNPEAYEHEYLGIPNGAGGNVFDLLEIRTITDEEIKRMDRIYQGVDFGWYPDQFAFLRTCYDSAREKIYLLDELYVNKWSNAQAAKWIIDKGYADYQIICDSAEPKSVNDFRDAGLPARGAVKGPGSVEYGFKWLQTRTLVIDPKRTPNAYAEIIGYEYERDKDGNVISGYPDENDHAISALRYAYEPKFNRRGNSA
ncbi:MAG: PBSX family phage terminase large subunit [Oscillospiraceae bacterium]|nr:PBSX family phage terminase large subunit [Oscillospiraceae bacterium]